MNSAKAFLESLQGSSALQERISQSDWSVDAFVKTGAAAGCPSWPLHRRTPPEPMTAAESLRSLDEIPGPPSHLLHGNIVEYRAGRLAFLERMVASYGNVVRYRFGCSWYYLINDAALARELFSDWDHTDNARNSGWL